MRNLNDPRQSLLFDVFQDILSPVAYRRLTNSWQHLFRCAILQLMPAGKLAEHFHPSFGRPTKELYSMAGLVFMMEFRDWTHNEAADAYMFNVDVQYALNLPPQNQSLCRRTIERYLVLFRNDELAGQIMHSVTAKLVELLELDVSKQRLDSTHIESNMAKFGRIKLMATAIRRFLHQVKRHDEGSYNALRRSVRDSYEASANSVFGWKKLDDDAVDRLRQSVAEDLAWLVDRYRRNKKHNNRSAYLMLVKVFEQQCDIVAEKVVVRKQTGGDIVCNPSDPDATFDGHKGSGYQIQLSETCSEHNPVQLIVSAIPETAEESDSAAVEKVLVDLKEQCYVPDQILADTAYGSDDNFVACGVRSIDLVSPTSGTSPAGHVDSQAITVADFEIVDGFKRGDWGLIEANPSCVKCPAGIEPHRSRFDAWLNQINILQFPEVCAACPVVNKCPRRFADGWSQVTIKLKQIRLIKRRRREQTDEFRETYRLRSGIEATNSILKRVTGLDRLRVRGRSAVFMSSLLKVAGWNLLRAATVQTLLAKLASQGLTQTAKFAAENQSGDPASAPPPTDQLPGRHVAPTTHLNA